MATLRPRNKKSSKAEKNIDINKDSPSKQRSSRNVSASGSANTGLAVPLLDMLAEVASATLKNDPSLYLKKEAEKMFKMSPRKSSQLSDVLNLDQIRVLSDRMLLEMFAELTSDEIRRHYSYKCFLVPEKCSESFKSFGSENRARLLMKSHLLTHIAELLADANSSPKSGKLKPPKFTAEPLHARKKRLQDGLLKTRHKAVKQRSPPNATKKSHKTKESQRIRLSAKTKKIEPPKVIKQEYVPKKQFTFNVAKKGLSSSECDNQESTEETVSEDDDSPVPSVKEKPLPQLQIKIEPREVCNNKPPLSKEEFMVKYVVDTLNQPQHDHNYTSVMGKKRGIEALHFEYYGSSDDDVASDDTLPPVKYKKGYLYEFPQLIVATPSFPFVYVPLLPNIAQILEVKAEEATTQLLNGAAHMIVYENVTDVSEQCSMSPSNGLEGGISTSRIVKAKTRNRRMHRLIIPEEMEADSEDNSASEPETLIKQEVEEDYEYPSGSTLCQLEPLLMQDAAHSLKYTALRGDESTPEWERKLALKFIRALRTKRKDERGPLVCKICKNKTFTAQATLMYHYRSHAGIKPFICSVCGATFTRQHSLNYHMLIHNNKSRFVCGDCGRNFRHPSHYKEHLRRHTGETPYECGDCGLRFKTRNTYKRHLKTRHGKLLTAQGIMTLTMEEFYKVRTTPRRRNIRLNPIRRRDQEWPENMRHHSP